MIQANVDGLEKTVNMYDAAASRIDALDQIVSTMKDSNQFENAINRIEQAVDGKSVELDQKYGLLEQKLNTGVDKNMEKFLEMINSFVNSFSKNNYEDLGAKLNAIESRIDGSSGSVNEELEKIVTRLDVCF